jgi:predicted ABC-class ATPase
MKGEKRLFELTGRINGKGYKAYMDLKGDYNYNNFLLSVDHVQRDPFASPSHLRVEVGHDFPVDLTDSHGRRVALEDYISRAFHDAILRHSDGQGSGNSGVFQVDAGGQEVLERSSVNIGPDKLEVRFQMGLPARGRRIMGLEARRMFLEILPRIVNDSCFYHKLPEDELFRHIYTYEDANHLRNQLSHLNLVAFIADGSILPRKSGISQKPLYKASTFQSPDSLRVTIETPNQGRITGMGIPEGVCLIVGGGYHGKSTLLQAVERGVYNHLPGDGRERVVTREDAVKIRAEDGRRVTKVDISSFIHQPPGVNDTSEFRSENASGSTSQAANIIEALEAGSGLLLFDEDTSASNFMIRDERMQRLVTREKEPITPFIDRVRELYEEQGVSSILVMGGSGDYFEVADNIIMMDNYQPHEVTLSAQRVSEELPTSRIREINGTFTYSHRCPLKNSINPYKGRKLRLDSRGLSTILMGLEIIDMSHVEQLVDSSQTRAIGYALHHAAQNYMDSKSMREVLNALEKDIEQRGLDVISPPGRRKPHNLAKPRIYEIAAAINRIRSLKIDKCTD